MRRERSLPVTIGIDLSTTAAKAVVVRWDGKLLATAAMPYETRFLPGGCVEQDAEAWWRSVVAAVRVAVARARIGRHRVVALAAATQGISIVPVDANGMPLRPSLNWLDTRATIEARELSEAFGERELYRITSRRAMPGYTLSKIAWLRRHEPEIVRAADRWLTPLPFLMQRLTGNAVSDHTLAAPTLLYDMLQADWSEPLLAWGGLSRRQLPPLAWTGTDLGPLIEPAAEALGLPADVRVVLGIQDQKSASYFAGLGPDVVTVSLGTAAAISGFLDHPTIDDERRIPLFPYVDDRGWVLEGVVPTAGASLEWLARLVSAERPRPLTVARLIRLADDAPPGAHGLTVVPHLIGSGTPRWDECASGTISGVRLDTSLADLARATLEGVARDIAVNVDVLRELGVRPREIRAFGGGAKSRLWCDIIAQATGLPVSTVLEPEAAALGAAAIARLPFGSVAS